MNAFGTLFFDYGRTGWSETYPLDVADYSDALVKLTSLLGHRLALAGPDVNLIGSRISDTDVKGDSFPTGFTIPSPGTWTYGAGEGGFNSNYALRIAIASGTVHRGSRWIRVIPSKQINDVGGFTPIAGYTTALNAFLADLVSHTSLAHKIPGAVAPPFYVFNACTSAIVSTMQRRQVGRPFGEPRGRRLIA